MNNIHDPFLDQKPRFQIKKFLFDPLFYSVRSVPYIHLKILEGRMHGPSSTSNFEGTVLPNRP